MLGLIATMIPMGPALKGLSDGNLGQVSDNLAVAFAAVILSLIAPPSPSGWCRCSAVGWPKNWCGCSARACAPRPQATWPKQGVKHEIPRRNRSRRPHPFRRQPHRRVSGGDRRAAHHRGQEPAAQPFSKQDVTVITDAGKPTMEVIQKRGEKIEKYKASGGIGEGDGEKSGVAYRMKDGSMVYVPEGGAAGQARPPCPVNNAGTAPGGVGGADAAFAGARALGPARLPVERLGRRCQPVAAAGHLGGRGRAATAHLPDPLTAFAALWAQVQQGAAEPALWVTARRAFMGLALALGVGSVLGLLAGLSVTASVLSRPLVTVLLGTPPIAWLVLAMLWFGMSDGTPVFTVFIACFPVVFASALQGTRTLDLQLRDMARAYLPLGMALREVYGPHVLSYLFPAWVTALGSAWKVAVMAELLASTDGVGAALAASRSQLDTATTLGWISAVVGCLLVVEYGFWNRSSAR
jgi:NitT/TauT family transport system permease protein